MSDKLRDVKAVNAALELVRDLIEQLPSDEAREQFFSGVTALYMIRMVWKKKPVPKEKR